MVVADGPIAPGERLTADRLRIVTADLPGALADRTFARVDDVAGGVALSALADGDPVVHTGVVAADQLPDDRRVLSFSLDRDRALDGAVQAGEALDLLATYGSGESAVTQVVARRAVVIRVDDAGRGSGLGGAGKVTVTVGLPSDDEVVRVAHASQVAAVTLVRSIEPGPGTPDPEARTPTGARSAGSAGAPAPSSTPTTTVRPGSGTG